MYKIIVNAESKVDKSPTWEASEMVTRGTRVTIINEHADMCRTHVFVLDTLFETAHDANEYIKAAALRYCEIHGQQCIAAKIVCSFHGEEEYTVIRDCYGPEAWKWNDEHFIDVLSVGVA